jgi:hypothetical protein
MNDFYTNWLPNIVCTVAGCVISWLIGYGQGRRAEAKAAKIDLMLEGLLKDREREGGGFTVIRDKNGHITGTANTASPPPT